MSSSDGTTVVSGKAVADMHMCKSPAVIAFFQTDVDGFMDNSEALRLDEMMRREASVQGCAWPEIDMAACYSFASTGGADKDLEPTEAHRFVGCRASALAGRCLASACGDSQY